MSGPTLPKPLILSGAARKSLPAGIYGVEVRHPGHVERSTIAVWPGLEVTIGPTVSSIETIAPTTPGAQADAATEISHRALTRAVDSRLFFFARSRDGTARLRAPKVWLLTLEGELIVRLHQDGELDRSSGYAGFCIDVAAGTYMLAYHAAGRGLRAQAIATPSKMESHVFVPWDDDRPDVARASVTCVPLGTGFSLESRNLYARSELIVDALSGGWSSPENLDGLTGLDPVARLAMGYRMLGEGEQRAAAIAAIVDEVAAWAPADATLLRRSSVGPPNVPDDVDSAPDVPPLLSPSTTMLWQSFAARTSATNDATWQPVSGSMWTRWRLDSSDRDVLPADLLGQATQNDDDWTPPPTPLDPPNIRIIRTGAEDDRGGYLAADYPLPRIPLGRHLDYTVLDRLATALTVVAQVRVRQSDALTIYQRSGGARLQYLPTGQIVPTDPNAALKLLIPVGSDVIRHLEQALHVDEQ